MEEDLEYNRGLPERFEIFGELGEGGQACVLAAYDSLLQLRRAIKLACGSRFRRRFRAEFRKLVQLRHPNIIRAYDYGQTERGIPYYSMEWVEGVSLGEFPGRDKPEVLAVIAMQLLDALASIHARGWVHRDIKPTNMLIVGEGRGALVRVIDLGHVMVSGRASSASGTLPYMAPEVLREDTCDARSDLYSLGVVLYEALIPELEAASEDNIIEFHQHLRPPHQLNPAIPVGFSDFIMCLLEENPDKRFESAHVAATALANIPELHIGLGSNRLFYERLVRGGAVSHRSELIEKTRRLAAESRREHRGMIALVDGPIGLGKTPFIRELAMGLSLDGFRILRVSSTKEPGSPILEILEMCRTLSLKSAMQFELFNEETTELGTTISAQATGKLAAFIARTLSNQPTALFVDDLQHVERSNLEVLRSLGAELQHVPLLIFCAGDMSQDGDKLAEILAPEISLIRLAPLESNEVQALVSNRLSGLKLPDQLLRRIVHDSEGMPSLVEKILAKLLVEQTIRWGAEGFEFFGGRYLAASHREPEHLDKCFEQVTEEEQSILWACGVLGNQLVARQIASMVNSSIREVGAALAQLTRIGILRSGAAAGEPTFLFSSRSFRSRAYQSVPAEYRCQLHAQAAQLIERLERDGRLNERLEHLFCGSNADLAIDVAVEAAERSAKLHANRKAIEYFTRAYSRIQKKSDSRKRSMALRLGQLFECIGELDQASIWYDATLSTELGSEEDFVAALLGLGNVAFARGLVEPAEEIVDRAMELLQRTKASSSNMHIIAMRLKALASLKKGASQEGEALLLSALRYSQEEDLSEYQSELLLELSRVSYKAQAPVKAIVFARKALRLSRKQKRLSVAFDSQIEIARNLIRHGRFHTARHVLNTVLKAVRHSGDRWREAVALRELGQLAFCLADLTGGLKRFNRSLELVRVLRLQGDQAHCLRKIGYINLLSGEYRSAMSALRAALDVTTLIGDQVANSTICLDLGHAHLLVGEQETSRRFIAAAAEHVDFSEQVESQAVFSVLMAYLDLTEGCRQRWDRTKFRQVELLHSISKPTLRAQFLTWMVRCCQVAQEVGGAAWLVAALDKEVKRSGLAYLGLFRDLFRAQVTRANGSPMSLGKLEVGVREASRRGLKPLEIGFAAELGRRNLGTDEGLRWLHYALERIQELSREMGAIEANYYLGTFQVVEIKGLFDAEWLRVTRLRPHLVR